MAAENDPSSGGISYNNVNCLQQQNIWKITCSVSTAYVSPSESKRIRTATAGPRAKTMPGTCPSSVYTNKLRNPRWEKQIEKYSRNKYF